MTATYNTRGIVLRYRPWREADRLYTVYTETHGKLTLRAHGVRRPHSKLAGALEPFAEIDLYVIPARTFHKIGGAVVQKRFTNLRTDITRYAAAIYCMEVVDRLTHEHASDPALYALLATTYQWLDRNTPSRIVVYSFVVKLIHFLGYDLAATVSGVPSPSERENVQKLIQWLDREPNEKIQKLRFSKEQWRMFTAMLQQWLREELRSDIQSERFLVY